MTKEVFISAIEALQKQYAFDEKISDCLRIAFDGAMPYDNHLLTNVILEILQDHFPPGKDGWCDIEYFMYELDFGKKWTKDSVTDGGKSIRLETPSDLWDYLTENKKKKEGAATTV